MNDFGLNPHGLLPCCLRFAPTSCPVNGKTRFYEKVVKVKADVAAILKFFLPTMTTRDAAPVVPIGGMRKGGFSGAL